MLVLKRYEDEEIVIDGRIVIRVVSIACGDNRSVKLAFEAPADVRILRREVQEEIESREGQQ